MINKKDFVKFYGVYVIWILIAIPIALGVKLLNVHLNNLIYAILESLITLITFIIVVGMYRRDVWNDFKKFLNGKNIFSRIIILTVGALSLELLVGFFISIIFNVFGIEIIGSDNNRLAQELLKSAPVLMGIGAVILAPIYEDVLFRLGLGKSFKNKKVFLAVSGTIFGIMHVVDNTVILLTLPIIIYIVDKLMNSKNKNKIVLSTTSVILYLVLIIIYLTFISGGISKFISSINISEVIYAFEYIAMGLYLTHAYLKTDNIWYSIIPHSLINLISTLFLYFG